MWGGRITCADTDATRTRRDAARPSGRAGQPRLPVPEELASRPRAPASPYGFTDEVCAKVAAWYPGARLAIF